MRIKTFSCRYEKDEQIIKVRGQGTALIKRLTSPANRITPTSKRMFDAIPVQ